MTHNANCLRLSDSVRELLTMMNFPAIPEEANYIGFLEDGRAVFIEDIEFGFGVIPQFKTLQIFKDVSVTL